MVEVMSDTEPTVKPSVWQNEVSAALSGALVGLITWILSYILSEYVIGQIACKTSSSIIACSDAPGVSAGFALVFASLAGLTFLVQRRIFRPLLVALASAITLWGVTGSWLNDRSFIDALLTVIMTAIVYLVFTWFAKLRQFWVSALISILLIVIFRLLINL
jgi:hypothetical protein